MRKILLIASAFVLTISADAQIKREQPKSGPTPQVQVKKPTEFKMSNGLTVMVVEDHKLPRVSYTLTIDTPPYAEGDKVGVSGITSAVVGSGTAKTSKEKFLEEADFMGANIGFWNTGASGSGLSKYADRILEMMAEGALYPLFEQEEFDKVKAQTIEGLKASERSTSAIASRVQSALLFGKNHPRGEFETEETINNITLDDVKKNYKDYFVPENAYLVIIGDVDTDHIKKKVESLFKDWKKASAPKTTYPTPKNVPTTQIDFVDVPNAVQSEIALQNLVDLKMTEKDYFAALMANQILGGGGEGRLFLNLREEHGWTYGAYSSLGSGKYTTRFVATASVRNTVTDSAVVEFMNELTRIRDTKVSKEELDLAKAKYIGNFVMETQKPGTIASFALRTKTQNLPEDFYENYIQSINAVTADDVQRAAKKYFLANNFRIVIAGKASEVLTGLESLDYPINFYDRYATPTEKPEVKTVDASVTPQTVLENYIKAIGGRENIDKITSLSIVYEGSLQGAPVSMTRKQTNRGHMLVSMIAMGQEMMKQVVTPESAYVMQQGQRFDMEGEDLKEMQESAVLFTELKKVENANQYTLTGIENFNDEDAYVLKQDDTAYYYSVATGLKLGEVTTIEQGGQTMSMAQTVGDYKEIKGVKIPQFMSIPLGPGMNIDLEAKEIKVNEGVTDADFK